MADQLAKFHVRQIVRGSRGRELRTLFKIHEIQRDRIGAFAEPYYVERGVDSRTVQIGSRVRRKVASRPAGSEPNEDGLQHILRVALAAGDAVCDSEDPFIMVAKQCSERLEPL